MKPLDLLVPDLLFSIKYTLYGNLSYFYHYR